MAQVPFQYQLVKIRIQVLPRLATERTLSLVTTTDLAALLKAARAAKGDSLRSAARELGVDASYLSRVEAGERRPSEDLQRRASRYYDVPDDQVRLAAG